jgi:ABC-type uncharacterized transport system substrate-binding protein
MSTKRLALDRKKTLLLAVLALAAAAGVQWLLSGEGGRTAPRSATAQADKEADSIDPHRTYKILHVMSYHAEWQWTQDQLNGFKDALRNVPVEYEVVEMDAKRNSTEAWKQQVADEASRLIETWRPDLVFTGDDVAQQYVATRYLNSPVPLVFCTVNADPEEYGFDKAANVTGVLERMHFAETVALLRELAPTVRTIAMITDKGAMWIPMIRQLKAVEHELRDVRVVAYDTLHTFEQYQQTVLDYQDRVDALGFLGVFEFADAHGNNVLLEDVVRWTIEHSRLPDFSFWSDRVNKGVLCAVTVSGVAQGRAAGEIARGVLIDRRRPSEYPMTATRTGLPMINLARARKLGLNPSATVLLTADVVKDMP